MSNTTVTAADLKVGDRIRYGYGVVTVASVTDGVRAFVSGGRGRTFPTCLAAGTAVEIVAGA